MKKKIELLSSYFHLVFTNKNTGIPPASCRKQKEVAVIETQNWQKQNHFPYILPGNKDKPSSKSHYTPKHNQSFQIHGDVQLALWIHGDETLDDFSP